MKLKNKIIGLLSFALIAVGLSSVPASALGTPKVQQVVSWGWEVGADKKHRAFSEDDYDDITEMPRLQITVSPASVGRRVVLEKFDEYTQNWVQELATRTDARGVAKILVNPLCDEYSDTPGMWCDHDVSYRIRVLKSGTQKALLSKTFIATFVASEEGDF